MKYVFFFPYLFLNIKIFFECDTIHLIFQIVSKYRGILNLKRFKFVKKKINRFFKMLFFFDDQKADLKKNNNPFPLCKKKKPSDLGLIRYQLPKIFLKIRKIHREKGERLLRKNVSNKYKGVESNQIDGFIKLENFTRRFFCIKNWRSLIFLSGFDYLYVLDIFKLEIGKIFYVSEILKIFSLISIKNNGKYPCY